MVIVQSGLHKRYGKGRPQHKSVWILHVQFEKEFCLIRPRITNKRAQNARKLLASTPESQLTEVAVC
jgi:hypothetical protein